MPGYLKRLAASAQNSNSRIHPMPRPLFAPLLVETAAPIEVNEEVEPSRHPTERSRVVFRRPNPAPPDQQTVERAAPIEVNEEVEPSRHPMERPRAVLREPNPAPPDQQTVETATPIEVNEEVEPSRHPMERSRAVLHELNPTPPDQQTLIETTESRPYVPKRDEAVEAPSFEIETFEGAPLIAPEIQKGLPRASAQFPETSPRQDPDEIHIHIGRVEVTALQPPPVVELPRPVRKTPSLDEYLKRGRR